MTIFLGMADRPPTRLERAIPLVFLGLCGLGLIWIGALLGFAIPVIILIVIAVGASICL